MAVKVIRCWGRADGVPTLLEGLYLVLNDVDARDGRGEAFWTDNPHRARRFADPVAAWAYWMKRSSVVPLRDDGEPNRPLTAYSIVVEDESDED